MPPRPTIELHAKACDLISAALRHLRDAETLLRAAEGRTSADGAYYLAGFAAELAEKATLAERWLDRAIGHIDSSFREFGQQARSLAFDLDPIARRYAGRGVPASSELERWSTSVRYSRTGSISINQAEALLAEARQIADAIVLDMWADGRFPARHRIW